MLLSFSKHKVSTWGLFFLRGYFSLVTQVQHVTAATRVEFEGRLALRTELGVGLLDVLVEASLVRNVAARELQHTLATERVLKRLLAHGALAAHKRAISSVFRAV